MTGDRGLDGVLVQGAVSSLLRGGRAPESSSVLRFRTGVDPSLGYPHRADGESGARHSSGARVRGRDGELGAGGGGTWGNERMKRKRKSELGGSPVIQLVH